MPISVGFYKKVYQWLMDKDERYVAFRPFLTNQNPYKARIFLVSSHAFPYFHVEDDSEKIFAEALVNHELLQDLYSADLQAAPREFRGSLQFGAWLRAQGESLLYTSLNTYQIHSLEDAKQAKVVDAKNYKRGEQIFAELLDEFQPEVLILQGATAFKQFKKQFEENLVTYNQTITTLELLEKSGPFAEMHFANGKKMLIFVTRSMSYFGSTGEKFEQFKEKLLEVL